MPSLTEQLVFAFPLTPAKRDSKEKYMYSKAPKGGMAGVI